MLTIATIYTTIVKTASQYTEADFTIILHNFNGHFWFIQFFSDGLQACYMFRRWYCTNIWFLELHRRTSFKGYATRQADNIKLIKALKCWTLFRHQWCTFLHEHYWEIVSCMMHLHFQNLNTPIWYPQNVAIAGI